MLRNKNTKKVEVIKTDFNPSKFDIEKNNRHLQSVEVERKLFRI